MFFILNFNRIYSFVGVHNLYIFFEIIFNVVFVVMFASKLLDRLLLKDNINLTNWNFDNINFNQKNISRQVKNKEVLYFNYRIFIRLIYQEQVHY